MLFLDARLDGLDQVGDFLRSSQGWRAVHFFTHGNDAGFQLGATWVNAESIRLRETAIRQWQRSLATGADLLFYECNLAEKTTGKMLLAEFHEWTGADIAASTNATGSTLSGADWNLEYQLGKIDARSPLTTDEEEAFQGTLGTFTVTNTNNSGAGSLRQAILNANAAAGPHTIQFNLSTADANYNSGTGKWTITPTTAFAQITKQTSIDGTTQSGYAGNPLIMINGASAPAGSMGFDLRAGSSGSSIKGLVVGGFKFNGININGSSNNFIQGNWLGLNAAGTAKSPNHNGLSISNSSGNTIGGTTSAARNVISGNTVNGMSVGGASSTGNRIQGNFFGTDATGSATPGFGNAYGVVLLLAGTGNVVGGSTTGSGNVISGNSGDGISVNQTNSVTVTGNIIGLNASGNAALGNAYGIRALFANTLTIGGLLPASRNVISGNSLGVVIGACAGAIVQGNFIGLGPDGSTPLGNTGYGLEIASSSGCTVGGTASGAANVISSNSFSGILLNGNSNLVAGNIIGLDSSATLSRGNSKGIEILAGTNNMIGGTTATSKNIIAGNSAEGVLIGTSSTGNSVIGNSIHGNARPGINLDVTGDPANGVTPNDGAITAIEPNNAIDTPVITRENLTGNVLSLAGYVGSAPGQQTFANVRVEVFISDAGGSGKTFLGFLTTDANGNFPANSSLDVTSLGLSASDLLTATATDSAGNTSEFSPTFAVNVPPTAVNDSVKATEASGLANATPGIDPTGNLLSNDTDVDAGDTKTVTAVATGSVGAWVPGSYGSIRIMADGSFSYLADNSNPAIEALRTNSDTLSETFTYTMRDAGGLTSTASVTITIHGGNDTPIANADFYNATEASGLANASPGVDPTGNVLDNDTDVDAGDTKTVTAVATGSVGAWVPGIYGSIRIMADGSFSYLADNSNPAVEALRTSGDTLTETFTYTMRDAGGLTSTATVTITIHGGNDTPIANADFYNATEASGLANASPGIDPTGNVLDNDTDVDAGDTKTVTAVATGSVGAWVPGIYGSIRIMADGSFSYLVDNSNPAVEALRTSGDTLTDTFMYTMRDADGVTSTASVTITIHGGNDTPIANADSFNATEASGLANATPGIDPTGNVLDNDTDVDAGDTKTVTAVATGSVGAWVPGIYGSIRILSDGSFSYLADNSNPAVEALRTSGDTLTDTFTYTMRDAGGLTSIASVTITIHGGNDTPIANADSFNATEASGLANATPGIDPTGNVLDNDTDVDAGDTKTVTAVANGSIGAWVSGSYGSIRIMVDGSFAYAVNNSNPAVEALRTSGDTLTDTFMYTMRDADGLTSIASVAITIHGGNDTPIANADFYNATEASGLANATPGIDPTGNVLSNDNDVDAGDTKTVTAVATGSVGAWVPGIYGSIRIMADGSFSYLADNSNPAIEALRTNSETLTETFTYTMRDAGGLTSIASVTITIHGGNDTPIANADSFNATEASGLANATPGIDPTGNVLDNDTDVDAGDTKTVTAVASGVVGAWMSGSYGSIRIMVDGSFSYLVDNSNPAVEALRTSGDTLTDTFMYTMRDGDGLLSSSTVTITIHGGNDTPIGISDTAISVRPGGVTFGLGGLNAVGNVLANDLDIDFGDTLSVSRVFGVHSPSILANAGDPLVGEHGTLRIAADGSYAYEPDASDPAVQSLVVYEDVLTDSFEYVLRDLGGLESSATLTVTIHGPRLASSTVLSSEKSSAVYGEIITLHARVGAVGNPGGKVMFMDGVTVLGTADLVGGVASWSTTGLAAGTHSAVRAIYLGDATFAGSESTDLVQVVHPASLVITANSFRKTYGNTLALTGSEFTVAGLRNADVVRSVELKSKGLARTARVSAYALTPVVAIGDGLANYDITCVAGTLTVDPARLIISATRLTKIYGESRVFTGSEFTAFGLVNGDTVDRVSLVSAGAISTAGAGHYSLTPVGAFGAALANYQVRFNSGSLTVRPASLTIRIADQSRRLGAKFTFGNGSFFVSGLLNGDTVDQVRLVSIGSAATAPAGAYEIFATGASGRGLANYNIHYVRGTLTVLAPSPVKKALRGRSWNP